MTLEEWRFSAKFAWQDRFIKWSLMANIAIIVGISSYILWRLIPEGIRSGVLTLHYTIYLGIDEVRPWPWITLLPVIMLTVWLANFLVSLGVYRKDKLAAKTLVSVFTFTNIIWVICLFFIVIVNI
ncbi:MAG: hypothetical protein ABIB04_02495 [Patescibacteria group bacterium]